MAPLKVPPGESMEARAAWFSMPLKHGPIEGMETKPENSPGILVFHAPKAWPH